MYTLVNLMWIREYVTYAGNGRFPEDPFADCIMTMRDSPDSQQFTPEIVIRIYILAIWRRCRFKSNALQSCEQLMLVRSIYPPLNKIVSNTPKAPHSPP